MLEVKNLSIHYGELKAVHNVSFNLKQQEVLGIIGESGSGKTTLARAIMRLVPKANINHDSKVIFNGVDLFQITHKELKNHRKEMQIVFQDPLSSFNPRIKVGKAVEEGMEIHDLYNKEERKKKTIEILEQVGLTSDAYYKYPHEFSGGQRQRIAIARALVLMPQCILADEPVSSLDVSVQAQILNLLLDLKKKYNLSYLLISHDLGVVDYLCDSVLVLYKGQMMEYGPKKILQNPFHPYTELLLNSLPENKGKIQGNHSSIEDYNSKCPMAKRCQYATNKCTDFTGNLIEIEPGHFTSCLRENK